MNSFFDFSRWLLFTGKHWNENKKRYLLSLAAIAGLLIIWYSFLIMMGTSPRPLHGKLQIITYFVGLFLVGNLHASLLFSDLADGAKGMHYLLIPASTAEKLLTALLFGVLLFFISYTIIFYAVDIPMVKLANSIVQAKAEHSLIKRPYVEKIVNVFTGPSNWNARAAEYLLLVYAALQAAFLLGSVYFPKYSFIKTAISLLLVFVFTLLFVAKVLYSFVPDGSFYQSLNTYSVYVPHQASRLIKLPEWVHTVLIYPLKYAFAPVFWIVTYFRLKEKEV